MASGHSLQEPGTLGIIIIVIIIIVVMIMIMIIIIISQSRSWLATPGCTAGCISGGAVAALQLGHCGPSWKRRCYVRLLTSR